MPPLAATPWVSISMSYLESIRSRENAIRFFQIFSSVYANLGFELMGQWEPLRDKFDIDRAILEWETNRGMPGHAVYGDYIYYGKKPAKFYAFVHWHDPENHGRWIDTISVMLNEKFWTKGNLEDPSGRALTLLKELATLSKPLYGRAFHSAEFEEKDFRDHVLQDGRVARESISLTPREGLVDLFWANFFGKPLENLFGLLRLQSIRANLSQSTDRGSLLVFGNDPLDWNNPDVLAMQSKAREEFDSGAFYDKVTNQKPTLHFL